MALPLHDAPPQESAASDPLRQTFRLLAAARLGVWPAWAGPEDVAALRRRVEALALLLDLVPRAEVKSLDRVACELASRFPGERVVETHQLRVACHDALHALHAGPVTRASATSVSSGDAATPLAGRPAEATGPLDDALDEWKARLLSDPRWTELPSFVRGEPPARIDQVYVELHAISEHDVGEDLNVDAERATRVSRRLLADRQPVVGVSALVSRTLERCVVVGEPGSGKSTVVQWVANATAAGGVPDYDHALVVGLSAFALAVQKNPDAGLLDFFLAPLLPDPAARAPALELLRRRSAEHRRHLLLLDGWDEVPLPLREPVRRRILAEAGHFVTVITSRPSGLPEELRGGGPVEFYRIAGLTPRAADDLTRTVLRRLGRPDLFEPIRRRLREEKDLKEMAGNPFLLGLLVRVLARAAGQAAPRSAADVYGQVAAWVRDQYNRAAGGAGELCADHMAALARLSYGLLFGPDLPRYQFPGRAIDGCVAGRGLSPGPILRSRFTNQADPAFDEYRFVHATFQEYFAATHAAGLPPDDLDRFFDDAFRSASRHVTLEFAAGLAELADRCRRKAAARFRSRDRFHHTLLRLARLAAAGRWPADDPDGFGAALRAELWGVIERKEYGTTTTAAVHAFAELDPADLVRRATASKSLDFLLVRNILDVVPRELVGPDSVDAVLDGPWQGFADLVVVTARTEEELDRVRAVVGDPAATREARTAAVRVAGMSRDGGSAPALIGMLRPDFADADLRKDAIDALGRVGGREASAALVGVLLDPSSPDEVAGHASAALSAMGSGALDPGGRDRLLSYVAAVDPGSGRLGDVLYALRGYPLRTGAGVVADLAARPDLSQALRLAAVEVVGTATDRGVVRRLTDAAAGERDEAVARAIYRLALDREVDLPDDPLGAAAAAEPNEAKRTLLLGLFLRQLARSQGARRVRGRALAHRLIVAALAPDAPPRAAPVLSRALTQPKPTAEPLLAEETLGFARGVLDAFAAARHTGTADQVLLAVNVVRHFPKRCDGRGLRAVLDRAVQLSERAGGPDRHDWDRVAGYVAALLAAFAPGELLAYPAGTPLIDNALREVSVTRGWLVFFDRIIDSEGTVLASADAPSSTLLPVTAPDVLEEVISRLKPSEKAAFVSYWLMVQPHGRCRPADTREAIHDEMARLRSEETDDAVLLRDCYPKKLPTLETWRKALNRAVGRVADDPRLLAHLVQLGLGGDRAASS